MLGIICLLLNVCFSINADCYSSVPGENIWRMVAQIGSCVDVVSSRICVVAVDTEAWLSILESVASMVESVEEELLNLDVTFSAFEADISSELDGITASINETIVSEIDKIKIDLLSVSDTIVAELSVFDSLISSVTESIIEVLESFDSSLSEDISALQACDFGTVITAADLAAGTYVITTPGVYSLCENVTTASNPGISIQADDVTLNLNGFTIFYNASNSCAISVPATFANVAIRNGFLEAINGVTNSCAIEIIQANRVYITDITSQQLGITIENSSAVTLEGYNGVGTGAGITATVATQLIIDNSAVTGSVSLGTPAIGIFVTLGDCTIRDTTVAQVVNGIMVNSVTSGLIEGVTVLGCTGDAYQILAITSGAVIIDRSTADNASNGILVSASANSLLRDCITNNCTNGVAIVNDSNSTVIKRSIMTQNTVGILIDNTSSNTTILESCPLDNTTNISDAGINTIFINLQTVLELLCSEIESFQSVGESILEFMEEFVLSLGDFALTAFDAMNETIRCLTETEIHQTDLPFTIPKPGIYTVCEPLLFNGGPVITNSFSDVVINLNGYSITTDNRAIVSTSPISNLVIKNGMINSGLEAVVIDLAQGVVVQDLMITMPAQVGFRFENSSGMLITNCTVCGNNGTPVGLVFPGSFYFANCGAVLIQACEVTSCSGTQLIRGFSVDTINPVGGILFSDCIASGIAQDGFHIGETSGDLSTVYLRRCQVSNAQNGFTVTHTSGGHEGPLLDSCTALFCTQGFVADMTDNVLLNNCVATNALTEGYLITSTTDTVSMVSCVSQQNGTGFILDGAKPVCDRCDAISNTGTGFLMSANAIGTILYLCLASRNNRGINDNNVAASAIVDTRSQDAAFGANPAYNLNTLPDIKGAGLGSVIIRTS